MPIYEFQCSQCGARQEQLMRLSDPDPIECPVCHAPALKRQVSAPSFRLAGGGWYETDFKKDGKRNIAGDQAESKPAAAAESKPDTKTEAKPAAKPEPAPAAPAGTNKPSGASG